jgi:hypothetical protein
MGRDIKHKKTTKGVVTTIVKREGDSDVAIKLWYDIAPVFFMTTIHGIRRNKWPYFPAYIRLRRRLKETSNAPPSVRANFDISVTSDQAKMFFDHDF